MKVLLSIVLSALILTGVLAQEKSLDKLNAALKSSAIDFPKSKVFIKTDKDIYASGEKIWFKAEVFNCLTETASNESGLVLMIKSESGEVIVDNDYLMLDGLVCDQITIPSWAPEGNAFLIAYTPSALKVNEASLAAIKPITINTLKNNDYLLTVSLDKKIYKPGDDVGLSLQLSAITSSPKREKLLISMYDYHSKLFTEKITVEVNQMNEFKYKLPMNINDGLYFEITTTGRNNISQKKPIYTTADRIKVEFYPEGGKLLTNIIQRIVYRATDPFGNPADITGFVFDPLGNKVGVGKIMKPGYGMISLMPMANQNYSFRLNSQYGQKQEFKMPVAILNGSSFTLLKTEKEELKAALNNTGDVVGQNLMVAAISGGEVKLSFKLEALQKNSFQISTADLPHGIINFVVLDTKGNILSERMIYNTPYEDIDIDIQTTLKPSEKNGDVEISINAQNFVRKFGESKIDVKVVDVQNLYHASSETEHSFLRYPLQTSTPKTVLDIYLTNIELIANNYRYFALQEIFDGVNYLEKDARAKNFSGTVSDKNGYRIPNATVMAVHPDNPTLESTTTDQDGRFEFTKISKSKEMVIKAISESGKKTYKVQLDRSFDETLEEMLLIESFKVKPLYSTTETPKYVAINASLLKQAGSETKEKKTREVSNSAMMLQSGSSVLDVIRMIKPFTLKGNQIVFYGTTNSINNQQGALIVVDGQKMGTSIDVLNAVNPHEVVSINVSTDPIDIQEYTALNSIGIIDIRTQGYYNSLSNRKKLNEMRVSEFDQSTIPANVWRYQTTLYWNPNDELDENGMLNLKLKTSEIQSTFIVQVDINSSIGTTHRQVSYFSTTRESEN